MAESCEHDWQDDSAHWNRELIKAASRCSRCGELRIQPVAKVPYITLRVSLTEDLTEPLQKPLPQS